jgi:FdhD protein
VGDRPRVGISACLLGEPVRYDGRHKRDGWLVEVLGPQVEWVPVCPEVEAGFGTPREPMHLVDEGRGGVSLMTIETKRDLTASMRRYAGGRVDELARADLDGYVLKADSPSCGLEGPGLFTAALIARLPDLPIADERQLGDVLERENFAGRVRAHHGARTKLRETSPWRAVPIVRVQEGSYAKDVDRAATEEPLEVRLHGRPFAVIMRTPGADRVITGTDDLGTIEHCVDGGLEAQNVVNVTLSHGSEERLARMLADRRQVTTSSSCGLCGRRTIESLATDVEPIRASWTVPATAITQMPARLRERQAVFEETGGLHAAGLFVVDGGGVRLLDVAEDVGRHNAVDKIVGRMLMREALPLAMHVLCVSGRTSFEIVQKALFAGIPLIAAVSAPSTLAIALAQEFGITLVGFVRGGSFTIYAHADRIAS